VASAGIRDDREQGCALVGQQPAAGREVDALLRADGVLGAVTLARISGAVEERIDGLIAPQVLDAKCLAELDLVQPSFPGGQDLVVEGARGSNRLSTRAALIGSTAPCCGNRDRSPDSSAGTRRRRAVPERHAAMPTVPGA